MARLDGAPISHPTPMGVLDIGSNSIRLVVFDSISRMPIPLFNEKALSGLGRNIAQTGRLAEEGVASAFANLGRFVSIAEAMGVRRENLDIVATAAVREAENGPDFVNEVARRIGIHIRTVSGFEEARLSAMGVIAGFPQADGVVGDLGGGSLELIVCDKGETKEMTSLPLGPLRLAQTGIGGTRKLASHIEGHLAEVPWLKGALKGQAFYAVGGAWRSVAKSYMAESGYPLHIIHGYRVPAKDLIGFLGQLAGRIGASDPKPVPAVSKRRQETVPHAALLLKQLIETAEPDQIVFSGTGLREGCVYDRLEDEERADDPLLLFSRSLATANGRFEPHGDALAAWTDPLFRGDSAAERRLRLAACTLSDIGWAMHPDYRAEFAHQKVLHLPVLGVDHIGRAYMALSVMARYVGKILPEAASVAMGLAGPDLTKRAERLGLALRLAHTLSGGTASLLEESRLEIDRGALCLIPPARHGSVTGDTVQRRLQALAANVGLKPRIVPQG
ncbi:MAG: Ppx/GppA family phosphatase [Alphaproteobacteria bacterium]|nr:Ppx/GppA family phosphatase [Alphaproteobacteria bacterium]